jgi:lipocalin
MVANAVQNNEINLDGCEVFINFLTAVRAAKAGDERLVDLFNTLKVSISMDPLAIYGWILSRAPLSVEQQLALKDIIHFGGK